jgi:hypothetical protein
MFGTAEGTAGVGEAHAVVYFQQGQLYSIPEHRTSGGLVDIECASALSQGKEDSMIQSQKSIRDWLSRYHLVLVLVLSLLHVSLAALHTRDSGKADLTPPLP